MLDSVTIRLGLFRQKLKLLCSEHQVLPVRGLFPGRWLEKHFKSLKPECIINTTGLIQKQLVPVGTTHTYER